MFTTAAAVAFVDDDEVLRTANVQSLELAGFEVLPFASAGDVLAAVGPDFEGVVVTDIRMPKVDGRQLFRRLKEMDQDLPVILITGHANIAEAVEAMHDGAYDYIAKPYGSDHLINSVHRALEKRRLVLDNRRLRAASARAGAEGALIGESPSMERLRSTIRHLADADVDVLLEGETGVGKELVARLLHRASKRRPRPFVTVDCAALPESMFESELFGHEPGAFAGAIKRRVGRIESAERGTLFIDEIESLSPAMQGKLLRVLEEREITPLGGNEVRGVDVRVIAAAKGDLGALAAAGGFRRDLYYRLNVVQVRIPPLRERRGDIPLLFGHFLAEAAARFRIEQPPLTDAVRHRLLEHDWPGNVRELHHFAERVALSVADVAPDAAGEAGTLHQRVENFEAQLIRDALAANQGDARATIQALSIPRKTFYDKLQRHGIDISAYRPAR